MGIKKITTLNIDSSVIAEAKRLGINISDFAERTLRERIRPNKKDLPEELKKIYCSKCQKEINMGYWCRDRNKIWCRDCHKEINIEKTCFIYHDFKDQSSDKFHEHVFWIDEQHNRPKDLEKANPGLLMNERSPELFNYSDNEEIH